MPDAIATPGAGQPIERQAHVMITSVTPVPTRIAAISRARAVNAAAAPAPSRPNHENRSRGSLVLPVTHETLHSQQHRSLGDPSLPVMGREFEGGARSGGTRFTALRHFVPSIAARRVAARATAAR